MISKTPWFAVVLAALLAGAGYAEDPEIKQPTSTELKGLVIDKTLTPPGRQFYRGFARKWWELNQELPGNMVVTERPSARRGSQIAILLDRRVVWMTSLSPARAAIKEKVVLAIMAVDREVKRNRYNLGQHSPDIGPGEL